MATMLDYFNTFVEKQMTASMIDLISQANVAINVAIKKASFMDGGSFVAQSIITGLPTSKVKAFTGPTTFDPNFDGQEASAVYPISFYGLDVSFTDNDLARIRGRKAFGNFVKIRYQKAEIAMRQRFGSDFWGDGTEDGGAAFVGMKAYIDSGATYPIYAGVDRDDITEWASNLLTYGSPRKLTTALIETADMDATMGAERPQIHFCHGAGITKVAQLIQPIQRAVQGELGSWGFKNIAYHGYPIIRDDLIPTPATGDLYYVMNLHFLQLWFLTNYMFQWHPIQKVLGTNIWRGGIMTACALAGQNPARQAVIDHLDFSL